MALQIESIKPLSWLSNKQTNKPKTKRNVLTRKVSDPSASAFSWDSNTFSNNINQI